MPGFRVMSFNIRFAAAPDHPNDWPSRAELNVRTIRRAAPELIGFQELEAPQWDHYHRHLPGYAFHRGLPYNNDPAQPGYAAFAWNADRFELVDHGGCWLSPTPDRHGLGWDARCVRCANWLRLRERHTGRTLLHANTHLDHVGATARLEGARMIVAELQRRVTPGELVLLTGDFNAAPGSPPHRALLDAGYIDTYLAAGEVDDRRGWTFHDFTGKASAEHGRIDWILALPNPAPPHATNAHVIRDAEPPLYPSDHWPITVDLDWPLTAVADA
ncbi:MAG: endonuclease/exonuclease/phosphatase family protein [Phycisphaeraceae bacterium]